MKTIQMTLDEKLLNKVDQEAKVHHKTRSAFIRDSIEFYLKKSLLSGLSTDRPKSSGFSEPNNLRKNF